MIKLLVIGFGGFLGSILRYVVGKSVDVRMNASFPWGTLTVNVIGSFIIGFVYMLAMRKVGITENWRLFLGAGFCGGFTTFSAFAWENVSLLDQKLIGTSLIYIVSSVVIGILAIVAGGWVSRFL
jgi:fluoride exporter